jgi:hypothetical protein
MASKPRLRGERLFGEIYNRKVSFQVELVNSPGARHRIEPSVYFDVRAIFRPANGALTFPRPYPALVLPQGGTDSDGAKIVPALRACVLPDPDIFTRIPRFVSHQGLVAIRRGGSHVPFAGRNGVRRRISSGPEGRSAAADSPICRRSAVAGAPRFCFMWGEGGVTVQKWPEPAAAGERIWQKTLRLNIQSEGLFSGRVGELSRCEASNRTIGMF